MTVPKNPHDRVFRKGLASVEVARSFFQNHLEPEFFEIINMQTLVFCSSNFIDGALHEKESDIMYQAMTNSDPARYIYLIVEHQSTPDRKMPIRLLDVHQTSC